MSSKLKAIKNSDFEEMKKSEGVYLIDFWAVWCGPCKVMNPIIEQLSEDEDLKEINFVQVNVDEEIELAGMFRVTSIPTFYLIKFKGDGTFDKDTDVLEKIVGAQPAFDFKMKLQTAITRS
jgi:thioredoxin 1